MANGTMTVPCPKCGSLATPRLSIGQEGRHEVVVARCRHCNEEWAQRPSVVLR
jgi:ssDNA-binding Zn-finger/Zn-ribbon topoisomerase 1